MIKLNLIVYDFDGVMTNNKVYINQNGDETVMVSRGDGLGIQEIKKLGIKQIILSTETNPVVSKRANKLGINCLQGIENKKEELSLYCRERKVDLKCVGYIGNDINDADVMKIVGYTFCPSDAHKDIQTISNHIFNSKGGDGVIRELFDFLIEKL